MITKPLVPLLAQSLGADSTMIGFLVAVQFLLPLILAIPVGQIVDSLGAHKVLLLGSILIFFSGVLYFLSFGIWILFSAQVTSGIGQLLVWLAIQTVATQIHPDSSARDSFVGYFGSFSAAGQLIAPILGGAVADAWGYRIALAIMVILGGLIFFGNLLVRKFEKHQRHLGNMSLFTSYPDALNIFLRNQGVQLAALCSFVPLFATLLRTSFLPLYLNGLGFSNTKIGVIVAAGPLAAIFCRATMGAMISIFNRRLVLFASIFAACIPMAVVPYFHGFWPLTILSSISGWGSGLNEPMTISLIAAHTKGDKRGMGMGLRLAANRLSMFLSPILFALLTKVCGFPNAFLATGSLLMAWNMGSVAFTYKLRLGPNLEVAKENLAYHPE